MILLNAETASFVPSSRYTQVQHATAAGLAASKLTFRGGVDWRSSRINPHQRNFRLFTTSIRRAQLASRCPVELCTSQRRRCVAMSFSIEVPGDANPLGFESLVRALQGASSTDYAQRQAAGQQLTSWEQQQGYYSGLQVCLSIPVMACLCALRTPNTSNICPDCLSRPLPSARRPLPRHHSAEKRH